MVDRRCRALSAQGVRCRRDGVVMRGDAWVCASHARKKNVIVTTTALEARVREEPELKDELRLLVEHATLKGRENTARIAQAALDRIIELEKALVEEQAWTPGA